MATSYPGGLDTFTALPSGNLSTATAEGRRHGARHNDVEDAVEAIEAELGTDPSGAAPTVAARLAALDVTVAGKETSGAAVAAVAAHAGAGDPHSQYATDSDLAAHVAASTAHIPAGAVALGQVGAVRWDETVGRRAFMWDTVNSRWQMVYGDTGWRDVTTLTTAGTCQAAKIRRSGALVEYTIYAGSEDMILPLPSGFQPGMGTNAVGLPTGTTPPGILRWNAVDPRCFSPVGGAAYYFVTEITVSYSTDQPWPTTLPGVASGTIPA